ncbi:MAG TPA: Tol-Pal system beta propeller repeat protein TolB [Thermoanaerobaculia bacterium]|jgi:TolB protein|nr:Tol-Pal system beta propeller repeat protein TolB [Thermoanaerobaculia bacterium]
MKSKAIYAATFTLLLSAGLMLPRIFAQVPQEPPPQAQPEETPPPGAEVTLVLESKRAPMKLAIPPFHVANVSGIAAGTAHEIETVVRQDLENSGYFDILGPDKLAGLTLSGDIQRDLAAYRSVGSQTVLLGDLRAEGDKIVFEGRLFEAASGQAILAKRYRGAFPVGRRIAHTFADEVIKFLTGTQGISLSSIAFTSDRSGNKEIYTMDYDGQNQRKVTAHRSTSMSPAWTPDGQGIAYTSFFNGAPGIYLADLASGRKKPLVTSGTLNMTPSFAPDGEHFTFARSVNGNVEIFSADKEGGNLRRLTNSSAIDANPAWSPKGGQIAFTSGRAGNPHIYMMDAEGTNQKRITFEGTYNDGAAWSPSGDLIAYTSRREGRFQIAVSNAVTLASRVLTSGAGENESPSFSPDGRKIVFVSARTGKKQLYVMDLDGSNLRQLTSEGNNDMPDWSRAVAAQ